MLTRHKNTGRHLNMKIIQTYPHAETYESVQGLYLDELSLTDDRVVVYANFINSLDGKIAIQQGGEYILPKTLTNANDLRLFIELRAQADCIITHAGYMRSLACGKLGDILNINDPDIAQWQNQHYTNSQPLIVICSNTLDFPMPEGLDPQKVLIATHANNDPRRIEQWQSRSYRVIEAGDQYVRAKDLQPHLLALGAQRIYLCAGPQLFESYVADRCVDRLYITLSMQFLGHYAYLPTMLGMQDIGAFDLELRRLVVDLSHQPHQLFAAFDCPS